jgi:hypothetical protein
MGFSLLLDQYSFSMQMLLPSLFEAAQGGFQRTKVLV